MKTGNVVMTDHPIKKGAIIDSLTPIDKKNRKPIGENRRSSSGRRRLLKNHAIRE